jgi:hypothetical protein
LLTGANLCLLHSLAPHAMARHHVLLKCGIHFVGREEDSLQEDAVPRPCRCGSSMSDHADEEAERK